jgi:hypothetical protein
MWVKLDAKSGIRARAWSGAACLQMELRLAKCLITEIGVREPESTRSVKIHGIAAGSLFPVDVTSEAKLKCKR